MSVNLDDGVTVARREWLQALLADAILRGRAASRGQVGAVEEGPHLGSLLGSHEALSAR